MNYFHIIHEWVECMVYLHASVKRCLNESGLFVEFESGVFISFVNFYFVLTIGLLWAFTLYSVWGGYNSPFTKTSEHIRTIQVHGRLYSVAVAQERETQFISQVLVNHHHTDQQFRHKYNTFNNINRNSIHFSGVQ